MRDSDWQNCSESENLIGNGADLGDVFIVIHFRPAVGTNNTVNLSLSFPLDMWVVDQSKEEGL